MTITKNYCDRCKREIKPTESDGMVSFTFGVERRGSIPNVVVCVDCYHKIADFARQDAER